MIKVLSIGDTHVKQGSHKVNTISYEGGITQSPIETFNYIIQYRPDIIVFATQLGSLEHLTVYQRIRNMYAGKYVPMILLVHEEDEVLYEDYYEDGITIGLHHDVQEETLFFHMEQLVSRCQLMRKNILVVDKDPVVLNTYCHFLGGKYRIQTASSTKDAVNYLISESVDAIICGISNADQLDLSLLEALQGNPKLKEIPIIAQTDAANRELLPQIFSYGVADCLIKPVEKETLLSHIKYVFNEEVRPNTVLETGKKRILLIDKQGVSYYSIRNILFGHYDSVYALPGVKAVSILEEERIDVILMNLDNGLFCLNKVMEKAKIKHIPIILLTSSTENINKLIDEQTRNAPCINCILDLPVSKNVLLDKLELAV